MINRLRRWWASRSTFVHDVVERAGKSFAQGAVAAVGLQGLATLASTPLDLSAWQAVGVAALGGGLTALFSFASSLLSKAKTGSASASTEVARTAVAKTLVGVVETKPYDPKHDRED